MEPVGAASAGSDADPKSEVFVDPIGGANRFEVLVQSIADYAVYMLDPNGIVASWNTGAERFKGYRADEIIGRHFSVFYGDEDRAAGLPRRALLTAEREGRFEAEGWRIRRDGTSFWAHVVIDPARDSRGRLIGFAKVTRDLTDRRAADDALRQSEERFRLLVQSVTDYAIYMLDPNGIVSSWNAGAERAKGYTADEIVGQHFSRFYGAEDRANGLPKRALTTAETTGRFEAEGWRYRKDGTRFWANVVIDPVRDPTGKLVGFAKVTRDLSERRESQIALEQAQQAIFQSQKMDAIGQLTGGVAHDFNNLLAAIMGSLVLARRRMANGQDATRFLDNAMQAAQRGATLTQRMLAFARKQELQLTRVNVAALLGGMTDLLQRTIGVGVDIRVEIPDTLKDVAADGGQLELAIINLAVNARDAMPDGGSIVVAADEVQVVDEALGLRPGPYVRLSVSDTGEGMDEQTLARAMEPFFTTKGIGKGTGLGLSMVHGLAQQCGGKLTLESHEGRGTTATLWLAIARDDMQVDSAASPPADLMDGPLPAMVVLVVDDDQLVLTNTVAMLEDLGHRVIAATSGADALQVLRTNDVEIVVTDYAMPTMDGLRLAHEVTTKWPGTSVLLVSGFADLKRHASADIPCLSKPFSPGQLARALAGAMRSGRTAERASNPPA